MQRNVAKVVFGLALALALLLNLESLRAQDSTARLSGTVTDAAGEARANARVSIVNASNGQSFVVQTDSAGHYRFPSLADGEYEISASADGLAATAVHITFSASNPQTVNLALAPAQQPTEMPSANLPNAPSSSKIEPSTEPSLEDLGFSKSEQQGNAQQQALLDKRTHMLKIHQRMGLITTIPLVATVILGPGAGGKSEGTAIRDLHVALGSLTGDLYGITAYYAIRAPRIKGTETRGPIKFHKAMAWIHGPGMILTPILGAMAFEQKNNGEKVHGIAQAHGPVAIVTAGAFGAALISVSTKF
jgi:carboxypeptidase family protein